MDAVVKGAIVSHLQKDGFPAIAEELSELTMVQPSKTENEIDLQNSIARLLEDGISLFMNPFSFYFLFLHTTNKEQEIENEIEEQLEYPLDVERQPTPIRSYQSQFSLINQNNQTITCTTMSSNGAFLLLGSKVFSFASGFFIPLLFKG